MDRSDTGNDDRYEILEGDLQRDRETVIGLWRGHIGWQDQLERMYDVFYLGCPFGQPLLRLLRHRPSGEIVGTIGAGPRSMLREGHAVRAAVLCHVAVLPAHRSLKPALGMYRAMAAISQSSFDVVYGLPNAPSSAICKRVHFALVGHLLRHVKVLRYRGYAQRVLPGRLGRAGGVLLDGGLALGRGVLALGRRSGLDVSWTDTVDPRMQALWDESDHGTGLSTIRSTVMLEWRFLGLPAIHRRFLLVGTAPGAPLLAWFACETNVRAPEIMTVSDAWFAEGVHGADRRAIRELCRAGYEAGYDAIEARLTAAKPVLDAWHAEGFITRGQQPFFAHGLDAQGAGEVGAGLHITDIEQDG